MSERVSLEAVAVRAMMFTSEGISALTSPSRLYSGRNDSPLQPIETLTSYGLYNLIDV